MKKERQKGSITVEATLFIPIFLFAFMSIYSLVSFASKYRRIREKN